MASSCDIDLLTYFLSSVTITSILRVTAVANSARNQQDLTWNFIQRGIWTLIEANLGIICACLVVLKRFFANMFGASKTSPTGGYGYGSSVAAKHTNGSTRRKVTSFRSRRHLQLDDTVDDDDPLPRRRSYQMDHLAGRGDSARDGRQSDEENIILSGDHRKREYSESSVDNVDAIKGWTTKYDEESGITKKVDVQIQSGPSSLVDHH
jgi:hypothetical protein